MTPFWSGWVMFLVVLNLGISLFLFIWGQRVAIPTEPDGTTGHAWAHGVLREGVRRLPLWWVLFSAAMFLAAFTYLTLYPGFGSFRGMLGWTSAVEWRHDTAANDARMEAVLARVRAMSIEDLAADAGVVSVGRGLYLDNCAACHGTRARGNPALGVPDLADADWLYGGDGQTLLLSILDGRNGTMPPMGTILGHDGVNEVAAYVLSLSGQKAPADWQAAGRERFQALCSACHGADARGNPVLGAPDLTDGIWLYGGNAGRIIETIREGRSGVMPAWRGRLGEDRARMVAAWVYAQRAQAVAD